MVEKTSSENPLDSHFKNLEKSKNEYWWIWILTSYTAKNTIDNIVWSMLHERVWII